jgi:hypothetical protein
VAQGRGIDVDAVMGTEARTLAAPEAMKLGFVDGLMPPQDAVQTFLDDIAGTKSAARFVGSRSAAEINPKPGDAATPLSIEEDDMPTPEETAAAEAAKKAQQDAVSKAAKESADRIQAILTSPEAKGREDTARHLAFNTDMSAEAAAAVLKSVPAAASGKSPLAAAMAAVGDPQVFADLPAPGSRNVSINPAAIYAKRAETMAKTAIH